MEQSKKIAQESKSSFYYAFNLLPVEKRNAMNTVYAFCRKTDDIVDEGNDSIDLKYEKLHKWHLELGKALSCQSEFPLLNSLGATIKKFNIPYEPFFELIKGMEMDLQTQSYLSFDDLKLYCYRVASTVGLMSIEIFGYKHVSTKEFAINLGIALQLTNILRDIKKDSQIGRIYLPKEDLQKFNYNEEDIFNNVYNENFVELMKFETKRAKQYFVNANENLNKDDKGNLFAARAMQHIYSKLLDKIIDADYNVYKKEIKVNKLEKVGIALGVWAKYSLAY